LISTAVVTPAPSQDLITLDDAKVLLGISGTSYDAALTLAISVQSDAIARMCNRVFGKEKVIEIFRCIGTERIFLNRWPISPADITEISDHGTVLNRAFPTDAASASIDYELDSASGMLYRPGGWAGPDVIASYSGGYVLPDEAPLALQQATALLLRQWYVAYQSRGMRMVVHKDSRVAYFDPAAQAVAMARGGASQNTLDRLLIHYTRLWA